MSNPTGSPECNFCLGNDRLHGKILAQTALAYLLEMDPPRSGAYLIVPLNHAVELSDLPKGFMGSIAELVYQVPGLEQNYNLSLNRGTEAGQTVMDHLHFWVIERKSGEPASGIGLYGLLQRVNAAGQ